MILLKKKKILLSTGPFIYDIHLLSLKVHYMSINYSAEEEGQVKIADSALKNIKKHQIAINLLVRPNKHHLDQCYNEFDIITSQAVHKQISNQKIEICTR